MAYDLMQSAKDYLYRNYGSGYKSYNDIVVQTDKMRDLYGKQTGVRSSLTDLNKQLKLEEFSKAARYSGPTSETVINHPIRTTPLTPDELKRQQQALASMTFNRDRYRNIDDESEKVKEWLKSKEQVSDNVDVKHEQSTIINPQSKQLAKWRTGWKGYALATGIQAGVDYGTDVLLDQTNLGDTSKNLISTGANVGSSLLANKLITGKMMLPGKFGKVVQFGLPIAMSLFSMFKSDDPDVRAKAEQEATDALAAANKDADKKKIADTLSALNSATNQAKKEYQSALQMGELIDPTGPVDLNRVQSIINEAKRAKEKYDLMDTMGAIYVMAGVQGGLDMIEKGKLLSSETAAKIAKLNADKESAAKGNKDAMGSLRKGLDDLDAIMGHNNAVISAFSARSQADYQNRSLENQKMETLMRISSGGKQSGEVPLSYYNTKFSNVKGYYGMLLNNLEKANKQNPMKDYEQKRSALENEARQKLSEIPGYEMFEGSSSGRSLSIK